MINSEKGKQGFQPVRRGATAPTPHPLDSKHTPASVDGEQGAPDYHGMHQHLPQHSTTRAARPSPAEPATVWVETIWAEEEIDISTVNDKVREVYATGQCWSLAREIALRIPDGRVGIVFAHHLDLPDDWEPRWGVEMDDVPQLREDANWLESARHVVAVDRYGWAYDVNGQHDSDGLQEMSADVWDADNMVIVDVSEYSNLLRNDLYRFAPEQNDEAAAQVADLLHPH